MQPTFEELLQIIRTAAESTENDLIRVVLASSQGDVRFIEVTDGIEFRTKLEKAFREGYLALGLLGWELTAETIQARSMLFPWHRENAKFCHPFQRGKSGWETCTGSEYRKTGLKSGAALSA